MKRFICSHLILISICFSALALAQTSSSFDTCIEQGLNYGNGQGSDVIDQNCFDLINVNANDKSKKINEELKTSYAGYKNIISIHQEGFAPTYIAGENSKLQDIQAIALDVVNKEIAVLEASGDLLFFTTQISGNIAPFRIIKSKFLFGATDLYVDSQKDEVIVFNKESQSILYYSRTGDYNRRPGKQNIELLRSQDNIGINAQSVIFDTEKRQIEVYSNPSMPLHILNF